MRELLKNILEKELVTSQEAANFLQVHPSAIRMMVVREKIPSFKIGGIRLFDIQDIKSLNKKQ